MCRLAQMTIAGVAGYLIAIVGGNSREFRPDVAVVGGQSPSPSPAARSRRR